MFYFFDGDNEVTGIVLVHVQVEEAESVGECITSVVSDVLLDTGCSSFRGDFQSSPSFIGEGLDSLGCCDDFLFWADSEKIVVFDAGFVKAGKKSFRFRNLFKSGQVKYICGFIAVFTQEEFPPASGMAGNQAQPANPVAGQTGRKMRPTR